MAIIKIKKKHVFLRAQCFTTFGYEGTNNNLSTIIYNNEGTSERKRDRVG